MPSLNTEIHSAFRAFERAALALFAGDDEAFEAARDEARDAVRAVDQLAATLRGHYVAAFAEAPPS